MGTREILPHEGKKGERFLRKAYENAAKYFSSRSSQQPTTSTASLAAASSSSSSSQSSAAAAAVKKERVIGFGKACYLHSHFYCNIYLEKEKQKLNEMWLHPILQVGEVVAGDEKLFHYTAHHMNTKAVPQKKDVSDFTKQFQTLLLIIVSQLF